MLGLFDHVFCCLSWPQVCGSPSSIFHAFWLVVALALDVAFHDHRFSEFHFPCPLSGGTSPGCCLSWPQVCGSQSSIFHTPCQVELALDVERVIPDFIRRKAFIKRKTIKPNIMFSNPISRFFLSRAGLTSKSLQQHLNPELVSQIACHHHHAPCFCFLLSQSDPYGKVAVNERSHWGNSSD